MSTLMGCPVISADSGWRAVGSTEAVLLSKVCCGRWTELQARPNRIAYRVDAAAEILFVKHYRPQTWLGRLHDFVWRRKPQKALRLAERLRRGGASTPRALGLFVCGWPLPREMLLVTEWLGDSQSWYEYLQSVAGRQGHKSEVDQVVDELALTVARLHKLGFYHGDLHGNLVLVSLRGRAKGSVIDLEELRPNLSWRRRLKNLAELGQLVKLSTVSVQQRWMFLRSYAAAAGLDPGQARRIWRQGSGVLERRMRRRARKLKRQQR